MGWGSRSSGLHATLIVDLESGTIGQEFWGHEDYVVVAGSTPDDRYLITGSWDATVRIWDRETGREIARLSHDADVQGIAVSADGHTLVTASLDGKLRVWDLSTIIDNHEAR